MKRFLTYLLCLLWLPLGALAQDEEKGGLEGLLERSLSSETFQVTVDGLSGALSSTASIEKLTFSDPSGPWLEIENAALNWTRTALLRGRVQVAELAAERIRVLRLPAGPEEDPELPSAAAEPFSFNLPELPVSIEVERFSAGEIFVAAPVIGEEVVATLEGGLRLVDGEGSVNLDLLRTDVTGTALKLDASFENETEELVVELDAQAREGGLIARKSGIPNAPALDLNVAGRGLLSDFTADVNFATADSTRLGGVVQLLAAAAEDPTDGVDRRIIASLSGDVRPLVIADLQSFFGEETKIDIETVLAGSGAIAVPRLHLTTNQLNLRSTVSLTEALWPEKIALFARLHGEDGEPIALPVPGSPTELSRAYISFSYDEAGASVWSAVITASDLSQGDISLDTIDLRGAGQLALPSNTEAGAVSGQLSGGVGGLDLGDPTLQGAVRDEVAFATSFAWRKGEPLDIGGAEIALGDVELNLTGLFANLAAGVDFDGAISLDAPDLSRFAQLAGQDLNGAVSLDIEGTATLLSGMFDLAIRGNADELRTGIAQADDLLGGTASLAFDGARDENGISIRQASLQTTAIGVEAEGTLGNAAGEISLTAKLDNLARLVPDLPGPTSFTGTVTQSGETLRVSGQGSGPAGLDLSIDGDVAANFTTADLTVGGGTSLVIASPFIAPRTATGRLDFDLAVAGPLGLEAVSGTVSLQDARVADPSIGFALENLGGSAQLDAGTLGLDFSGRGNRGGRIDLGGSLGLTGSQVADLSVVLDDLRLAIQGFLATELDGEIAFAGPLTGGAALTGVINVDQTEIRVPDGAGASGEIDGLRHVRAPEPVRRTLTRAGLVTVPKPPSGGGGPAIGLDLTVNAPSQIFVRGFGLDAELGGDIRVTGTTADPRPVGEFDLVRGRLNILGQRLELTEGNIRLSADLIPDIRFVATVTSDDVEVSAIVEGPADDPEVSFESNPPLPEDEALARLLFNADINSLSPIQALRLANALIAVQNGTGLGLFNSLREEAGLDDLDLVTDEDGQTSLRLGKYISDDVYTNVDVNADGETEIILNIDLTDSLTARGTAGTDDSAIGLFFERDY
ncbi:protein of unknown function DUF490 [Dinoroseobacter shibae DFL 12 = DSM 16493]|uniref:Translocation and assembly module TamB C-terminal domain-containing protein n=1 Tax=Dinoroseobacter shibae (strain DSM 16493 / NCIMB 14021 / DFL 12) TaxID=398580 RepID=A8LNM1_DINSH|nr:translocation/assembly module TamB domain-containing protein [Dinoroseobacter shibae]ABV95115.1 protein of unknown function DUF490 [Dinoroseobacter shibae DFL 12 = DSM 16493]URF46530.1 translocation/assembly module TamB domain-containing protein [Dinoroseobacter shibae]URF50836.1 translocation/assembly module TamB domain-containing protein [Dinoroseobacter shibae]